MARITVLERNEMEQKCEYCGSFISDTDEKCPNCGAVNDNLKRMTDGTPQTIDELKQWYIDRKLPPMENTRFFIGINYTEPRAFGIYEENGEFVVYKNKDDGTRAIRYRGTDEAYAVNELFLKLKSEILNQKSHNISRTQQSKEDKKNTLTGIILFVLIFVLAGNISTCGSRHNGYYSFGNDLYYNYNNTWYEYDWSSNDYYETTLPGSYSDNYKDYKIDEYEYPYEFTTFSDSETGSRAIEENSSDSDYDWDSDSDWDSGSTDWGSDW